MFVRIPVRHQYQRVYLLVARKGSNNAQSVELKAKARAILILVGAPEDLRHESNVHPILYVDPLHGGYNVDGLPDGGHVLICSPMGEQPAKALPSKPITRS